MEKMLAVDSYTFVFYNQSAENADIVPTDTKLPPDRP